MNNTVSGNLAVAYSEGVSIIYRRNDDYIIDSEEENNSEEMSEEMLERFEETLQEEPENDFEDIVEASMYKGGKDMDLEKLFINEVCKTPLLSTSEEFELAVKAINGDNQARDCLVSANMRWVINLSNKYLGHGLEKSDLIQTGAMGLMKAITKFDPYMGYKFSTYATWWIRQVMLRAIANEGSAIRKPVHIVTQIGNMKKVERRLEDQLLRKPSDRELAFEMDIDEEKLVLLKIHAEPQRSLEINVGEDADTELKDFIPNDGASVEEIAEKGELKNVLEETMEYTLTEREKTVLSLRFGLADGRTRTLEEIGEILNVTRERIRQIEAKALRRLSRKAKGLKEFLS